MHTSHASRGRLRAIALVALVAVLCVAAPSRLEAQDADTSVDRVHSLMDELEELRGLDFLEDVGVEVQSTEEFEEFVREDMDETMPVEVAEGMSRALAALGVLPEGYDMREGYAETATSQAAAYYDPEQDTFFILAADMPQQIMDMTIVHELQHAMQDQHFDLGYLEEVSQEGNDDRVQAYRFLVEGEANYIGQVYMVEQSTGMNLEQNPMAEAIFRSQAHMRRAQFIQSQRQQLQMMEQMGGEVPQSMIDAMEATEDIPWFVLRQMMDAYNKGALAVLRIKRERGWDGIEELFRNPPPSTELLMHPEKLLRDEPDWPTTIELASMESVLPDHDVLYENTLGEAGMDTFLECILDDQEVEDADAPQNPMAMMRPPEPTAWNEASEGWDGDRFRVYESPDDSNRVVTMYANFDTEGDAAEFLDIYREVLDRKFPEADVSEEADDRHRVTGDGHTHLVERHGKDVLVVEGATPENWTALRDALLATEKVPYSPEGEEDRVPTGGEGDTEPREF